MKKSNKVSENDNADLSICFISNSAGNAGGAEKTFPKFVNSHKLKGIKVYVILPSVGPMVKELEMLNIEYKIIPFRMWMNYKSSLLKKFARNLYNLLLLFPICLNIVKWKCNVVFSNTVTVSVGALAAKLTGRKHFWYIREFGYEDHGRAFDLGEKFSNWLIQNLSDIYIFNSLAVQEKYKNFIPFQKRKVVYEGYITDDQIKNKMSFENFREIKGTTARCLMIGTLQAGKGHFDAVNSLIHLRKDGFNMVLDIVGQGYDSNYLDQLNLLISKNKLENNVFFYGNLENPFPILKKCDIFLMCSKKEAFGIVTIEAMQFGKPVIGTRSGGTKELIIENFNGLFYTPGDSVELAQKIKYLLENPDVSKQFGENGRNWVFEKFTYKRYINEMAELLLQYKNK